MAQLHLELMPEEEKILEAPPPKTIVVRYGYLREIGEFPSDLTSKVGCGTKLVIRTDRGVELGEMLTTTCGNGGCNKSITRDKLLDYIEKSGGKDYPFSEAGRVLRPAPGKVNAIVLDHSGAVFRHGFVEDRVEWALDPEKRQTRMINR